MLRVCVALIFSCVLASCAKSRPATVEVGGETNWLVTCDDDSACEQGACLCGVCTTPCKLGEACGDGSRGACVSSASAATATLCASAKVVPDALCLAQCEDDEACGKGFACREHVCVVDDLGDDAIAEDDFVMAFSAAQARRIERCCVQQGSTGALPTLLDDLVSSNEMTTPAADSNVHYDARAAAACIAEIDASECLLQKEMVAAFANPGGPCAVVYRRGNYALGERCRTYYECSEQDGTPTRCDATVENDQVVWVCGEFAARSEGESCADGACRDDLMCDPTTLTCAKPAERGERCIVGAPYGDTCAMGSVCDRSATETCIAPRAVGAACGLPEQCENLACTNGRCLPPLFFGNADCVW